VEHIPRRPLLILATLAGVVITEAVDDAVPQRLVLLQQQPLREGNPKLVHHQVTASEVSEVEVACGVDRLRVL